MTNEVARGLAERQTVRSRKRTGWRPKNGFRGPAGAAALAAPLAVAAVLLLSMAGGSGLLSSSRDPASASGSSGAEPAFHLSITLNRTSGVNFNQIVVTLAGFVYADADGTANVSISNASVPSYSIYSDPFYYINSGGGVSETFPDISASPGLYVFTAEQGGVGSVSTTYLLTAGTPRISTTLSTCGPGHAVDVTGPSLPIGYPYTIGIGSPTLSYIQLFSGTAGLTLDTCVSLPSEPLGYYVLSLTGMYGSYYAAVNVSLDPILTFSLTPSQGTAGTFVSATGAGFPSGSSVTVYWSGGTACTTTANSKSDYACSFTMPSAAGQVYTFTATDSVATFATTNFSLTVPRVALSPSQGPEGAIVDVIGHGFTIHSTLPSLTFGGLDFTSGDCLSGSLSTGVGVLAPGEFSCTLVVPPLSPGSQTVTATDILGGTAVATFDVTSPSLSFSPGQGPVGATVTLTGHGFSVDTPLASASFDGVAITSCLSGSLTTGTIAPGGFSCTFDVPAVTPGVVSVTATDVTGAVAPTTFLVTTPTLTLSAYQGPDDARITVVGHGFSVDTPIVSLVVGGFTWTSSYCLVGSLTTGTSGLQPGEFSCTLRFTDLSPGTIYVNATDVTGLVGSVKFLVTNPTLIVTPASGPVGSTITVIGHGFSVDAPIRYLDFDVTNITTCSSGSLTTGGLGLEPGEFSCSFTVPSEFIPSVSIDAVDWGYSTGVTAFTIT